MKTFLLLCVGVLILTLSVVLGLVAYVMFDEARNTWEANRRIRRISDGQMDKH